MGRKAEETTCNIHDVFGPRNSNKHSSVVVQEVLKGDKSLEEEKQSSWASEVDNDQLRAIIKADPLMIGEVAEELNVNHSMVVWHLKQIRMVKKLGK